jgi:hypothetical protein
LTTFEGVELTGDLTRRVADQLATGRHRGPGDSAPGDWLARAWRSLPPSERARLTAAVHEALTHPDPQVRAEAVRLLDGNPRMADPQRLLEVVEGHWDLFRGLRASHDPPGVDRGRELVQLVADRATGPRGSRFRQRMARDPVYGLHVLAALAEEEPAWTAAHIDELVSPGLDPDGTRLKILLSNLQQRPEALRRAVANLVDRQPALRAPLAEAVRAKVRSSALRSELLQILS